MKLKCYIMFFNLFTKTLTTPPIINFPPTSPGFLQPQSLPLTFLSLLAVDGSSWFQCCWLCEFGYKDILPFCSAEVPKAFDPCLLPPIPHYFLSASSYSPVPIAFIPYPSPSPYSTGVKMIQVPPPVTSCILSLVILSSYSIYHRCLSFC